ncbi:YybH family protein [Variovorax boronicumulans]|uniref:YybH family protein n=1 Tax=Variovorax boronicumulans TaxID=436515 RepID=UPI002785C039|nr:nuclear transport factor 2 family protein [Variovorax boronicumulans]MDQ0043124.1 ketosteroid isomerase-like protein [Variovorax boronicumulans]
MNKLTVTLLATCMAFAGLPAFAADDTAKSGMRPATTPRGVFHLFVEAMNTGKTAELMQHAYVEGAVMTTSPQADFVQGKTAIAAKLQEFVALKGTIRADVRTVLEQGDVALAITDWAFEGRDPGTNKAVSLGGTATDVLRRDADGTWRFAIDNPYGIGR